MNNEILINNAGLVLVNPFLTRYFQMLDMLDKNEQFKDEYSQERAVNLIQYLATGQQETAAHLLILNKILCGLNVKTPVPLSIEISEQEIDISEQLLNSVIQNWDKMSNFTRLIANDFSLEIP